MGLSRRAYARHRGCAESAVRKALASGRIALEADGTIDPARADIAWAMQTDPAMQRPWSTQARPGAGRASRPPHRTGLDHDEAVATGSGEISYLRARMANEVLKAQTARVRLAKLKGELVDRHRATELVFTLARRERDAWVGWPARVAANMAAELGADPHAMEQVLERYLREHLAALAEVKIDLR